jgi:LysM repeat protein
MRKFNQRFPKSLLATVMCGCASIFHAPVDEEGTSFSSTNYIEPRSFSADVALNILRVDPESMKPDPRFAPQPILNRDLASTNNVPINDRQNDSTPAQQGTGSPDLSKVVAVPKQGTLINHTVTKTDTLMKLAFRYKGNVYRWKEIYHLNQALIPDFNKLKAGTVLKIYATRQNMPRPPGHPYHIIWGDSLIKISDKVYGTKHKWKSIWHNNQLLIKNPNKIYAGFNLYYRGDKVPTHPTQRPIFRMPASSDQKTSSALPIPLNKSL